jgi:hypothetical protein
MDIYYTIYSYWPSIGETERAIKKNNSSGYKMITTHVEKCDRLFVVCSNTPVNNSQKNQNWTRLTPRARCKYGKCNPEDKICYVN